jgi:hypothetical protein
MYMKKYLLLCIIGAAINAGYAQTKFSDKGITMIKGAINSGTLRSRTSSSNEYSSSKSRIGYGIGIERITPLYNEKLLLSTQIALNSLGYKNVRTNYINVPITVNFFLGRNKLFYVGAGMYGGLLLSGKYKNINNDWIKMKIGDGVNDNRSRTDYGMIYTIAYTFGEGFPIVQMHIMSGIKNLIPEARQTNGSKNKINSVELALRLPLNVMKKLTN